MRRNKRRPEILQYRPCAASRLSSVRQRTDPWSESSVGPYMRTRDIPGLEDWIRRWALVWWNEGNEEGALDLLAIAREVVR